MNMKAWCQCRYCQDDLAWKGNMCPQIVKNHIDSNPVCGSKAWVSARAAKPGLTTLGEVLSRETVGAILRASGEPDGMGDAP